MRGHYGFHHPTFIYGYDGGERIVYIADNFERGKYGTKKITYDQLDRVLFSADDMWKYEFIYRITSVQYSFQPGYVREQLMTILHQEMELLLKSHSMPGIFSRMAVTISMSVFDGVQCYDFDHLLSGVIVGRMIRIRCALAQSGSALRS